MARRKMTKSSANGLAVLAVLVAGVVAAAFKAAYDFVMHNGSLVFSVLLTIVIGILISKVIKKVIAKQRKELYEEILDACNLKDINLRLKDFDDRIEVKSKQTLENYTDLKYLKDTETLGDVLDICEDRRKIRRELITFLEDNAFMERDQYDYVKGLLEAHIHMADGYRIAVEYVTSAGNVRGARTIIIDDDRAAYIDEHPELLMTKGEYNKLVKQQAKEELDDAKHEMYGRVNEIIDLANETKESLIVKKESKKLDALVQKLFEGTVNTIQKIKTLDSDEWDMLDNFISENEKQIRKIVEDDKKISDYYGSEDFTKIKETCEKLTSSQREFNEYIDEKAQSIQKLFGTRVTRNETENEDVYNYIRAYKKSITPFTAEVSSSVFSSAENNPLAYVVKYFYPNKSQYKEQIEKLRVLIEELETLKEAKVIIDNYKKDYDEYIQSVPAYVLENDEDGFYKRLGLAIIDEAVLNVEYRFTYTSGGGMAQRSFSISMTEENIIELINLLESKLTQSALAKEQRALMTSKLRAHIKERDNFTCCQCGNSTHKEPNLLLEIDHIVPVSKGGLTQEDNLQTLCWKCNRSKGAKLFV